MNLLSDTPISTLRRRVAMADVDAAQILYFATPFRWFEAQFTDHLATAGHPLSTILAGGVGMPIVSTTCEFLFPLALDDVVDQHLFPDRVGRSSFTIRCDVGCSLPDDVAVRVSATYVWGEREGDHARGRFRPAPVPDWLRTALGLA